MSPAVDTAHDGVAFLFQTVSNSCTKCVGMDINLTDTPMHSFMGGVTVHTASPSPFPMLWLLIFLVVFCRFFWLLFFWLLLFFFYNSGMAGGKIRLKFSGVVSSVL